PAPIQSTGETSVPVPANGSVDVAVGSPGQSGHEGTHSVNNGEGDNGPTTPLNSQPMRPAPGHGTPLDRLLSSAKAGNPKAQLLLGLRYLDGDGVAASDSEAVRWLRKSAEQGDAVGQYRLGTMYERGRGVSLDTAQAKYWYEQAARHGNRKAMHNLAVAYAE